MNAIPVRIPDAGGTIAERRSLWQRRVIDPADPAGLLVCVVPLLLGIFFMTGVRAAETAIYAMCTVVVLPRLAPFVVSMRRNGANTALLATFVALGVAMLAAAVQGAPNAVLQSKALAATAVWASIYVIAFTTVDSRASVLRFTSWIRTCCVAISASVYLCVALHFAGIPFGEFLQFRDGSFRAFGPLGDQVSFVVILPALVALAEARPVAFAVHFGALLLTATRGALLALVAGIVVFLLVMVTRKLRASRQTRGRGAVWGLFSIGVAALIMASPVASNIRERITMAPTNEEYSFRWTAITAGVDLVAEHPLLGVGFNGFGDRRRAIAEDWLATAASEAGLARTANQYVQTATDGGLPAAFALLLFVGLTLRNAWRAIGWRAATAELVGTQLWLIAVLLGNQGAPWLLSDAVSGFFLFAVAAMAARAAALARRGSDAIQA
ncbi:MAG TPA: O-antigen ligase family protein [Vicinamibacterales bacterium]|jgi:O-antigen ligase|nr:O-antigen ligase family protein [Vicinamibacterales bacterium]